MFSRNILWVFVVLAFAIGYKTSIIPLELDIAQTQRHASQLYRAANKNEAIARRARELKMARRRIAADVARLNGPNTVSTETASLLRLFVREEARYHVAIHAISADNAASAETQGSSGMRLLKEQPLTLTVRGSFRKIVPLLADLPRHDVLIEIRDAQLRVIPRTESATVLEATVAAALYRLRPPIPGKDSDVSSTLR